MSRHSQIGGQPVKTRTRKTVKRRTAPRHAHGRISPAVVQRLTRELSEARDEQAAISEVLRVISSSPGDLKPVFEAILENAVRLCDAKFGNLYLREGDGFRAAACVGEVSRAFVREPY